MGNFNLEERDGDVRVIFSHIKKGGYDDRWERLRIVSNDGLLQSFSCVESSVLLQQ
jgi:hypothetical protein